MKRWMLCLLCTITLGLCFTGLASAEPASGASAVKPAADQQFLKSLGMPEPTAMACAPGFCNNAAKQACWDYCWATYMCTGGLSCNYTNCTTTCWCSPVACYG